MAYIDQMVCDYLEKMQAINRKERTKVKDIQRLFKLTQNKEALKQFAPNSSAAHVLPETEETALINVIRSFKPLLVVDESHNTESELSTEMLQNLNPGFVLDLKATPKEKS